MSYNIDDLLSFDGQQWVGKSAQDLNEDLKLNSLKDVVISGIADKFVLVWDASLSKWKVSSASILATEVASEMDLIELKDVITGDKLNAQSLVWDSVTQAWINRYLTFGDISDFDIEPGQNTGDILIWNSVTNKWESSPAESIHNVYSLDEKVIGTWLSDELIYRKVITFDKKLVANIITPLFISSYHGFPTDYSLMRSVEGMYTMSDGSMRYSSQNQFNIVQQADGLVIELTNPQSNPDPLDEYKSKVYLTLEYIKGPRPITTTTSTTTTTTTLPPTTTTSTTSTTTAPPPTTTTSTTTINVIVPEVYADDVYVAYPGTTASLTSEIHNVPSGAISEWALMFGPVPPYPTEDDLGLIGIEHNTNLSGLVPGTYAYEIRVKYPGSSNKLAAMMIFVRVEGPATTTTTSTTTTTTTTSTTTTTTTLPPTTTTTTTTTLPPIVNNNKLGYISNPISEMALEWILGFPPLNYQLIDNEVSFFTDEPYELDTLLFQGSEDLYSVDLQAISLIKPKMFESCSRLYSITFPNLTIVPDYSFHNCIGLNQINLNIVESLGESAFKSCISITSIKIPSLLSTVGSSFEDCINLTGFILPNLNIISDRDFFGCTSLGYVDSKNIIQVGISSFEGCISITKVHLDVVSIIKDYAFKGCSSLATVFTPGLITLGKYAFLNADLSDSNNFDLLTTLGEGAFASTRSTIFDLPSALYVGNFAFSYNPYLVYVNLPIVQNLGENMNNNGVFYGCTASTLEVTVPENILTDLDLGDTALGIRVWSDEFNNIFGNNPSI